MAGLFFASFFSDISALALTAAIAAAALVLGGRRGFRAVDYVVICASFVCAAAVFGIYTSLRYAPAVSYRGSSGSFRGEVVEAIRLDSDSSSYILNGSINGDTPVKVSFYGDSVEAECGDIINIESCRFDQPRSDYLFDGQSFYRSEGVFLTLGSTKGVTVEHTGAKRLKNAVIRYREGVISEFRTRLGENSGDLLAGMVFGEKRGMDENVRISVYRCGIGHVLAVSGLHVSVAVVILMGLLKRLRVNKYVCFAVMELLLLFLIVMANYPVSAVRAAIMMNFMWAAGLFLRQSDTFNSLAGAVLIICIFNPYAIYDEGFLLSVVGTFGIGVFGPYMVKEMPGDSFVRRLVKNSAVMLCTTLAILPLSLRFFDETSLISPVTNVVMIPLCSAVMVMGLLYALTGGLIDLLEAAGAAADLILRVSDKLSRISFTHFSCSDNALVSGLFICTVSVILVFVLFRSRKYMALTIAASLVFMFAGAAVYRLGRYDKLIVTVLGRGNNAAVVVTCKGSADIIDLSGHYRSAAYVRKYLMQSGISEVDTVVLTRNVQSRYSGYLKCLEFIHTDNWLAQSNTDIAGGDSRLSCFDESGCTADHGGHTVEYRSGVLTVRSGTSAISFAKAGSPEANGDGLTVFYGNVSRGTERLTENCLYLDDDGDINNFEIVMTGDGSYVLRRL